MWDWETIRAQIRSPAALGALAANLVPVFGVLAWGWDLGVVVVLYWLENLVIGVVNLARMTAAGFAKGPGGIVAMLFLGPFFTVHYGGFCLVHGVFVLSIFGSGELVLENGPALDGLAKAALGGAPYVGLALAALALWRALAFSLYYIGRGEHLRTDPASQMMAPYGRIVFLHFGIFAAGFALMAVGEPVWGVAALAALKTLFDMLTENRAPKLAAPAAAQPAP